MIKASSNVYIENGKVKKIQEFTEEKEGKIIYEVIRIIQGKPLFFEEHYDRMVFSFQLNDTLIATSMDEMKGYIETLINESKTKVGNIKITYNINTNNLRIYFIKHKYPTKKMYTDGVETILCFKERENPNAKVINERFREDVNAKIEERKAYEAILVNREGLVTEGSKSNIFMIKENRLYTSKIENVLPGITRTEIIRMAIELNVPVIEEDIKYIDIDNMDAAFISGTSPNILPINMIEEKKFDCKNELLLKLMEVFDKRIEKYVQKNEQMVKVVELKFRNNKRK